MAKPTIEELEHELRQSRTQAWDVEKFLAARHQAKIDKLEAPGSKMAKRWVATKEALWHLSAVFGIIALYSIGTVWLLDGRFPLHVQTKAERVCRDAYLLPSPAGHRFGHTPTAAPAPAP